jgi:hypothetical protein
MISVCVNLEVIPGYYHTVGIYTCGNYAQGEISNSSLPNLC